MERLTERTALGICGNNERVEHYPLYNIENDEHMAFGLINQCFEKLAEYEQAEEDGLLKMLPCKVGDVVYKPNPITMKEIVEIEIESIFITASGTNISGRTTKMKYSFCCSPSDFGKTVFLTEAEAEQALAKMKGEM